MNDDKLDQATRRIELQRLIDGRMPALERAAFLDCIDDEPALWREVALAFVEEQVIQSELQPSPPVKPAATPVSPTPANLRPGLFAAVASVIVALLVGGAAGRWTSSVGSPPVAAPSLLVNDLMRNETDVSDAAANGDYYVLLKPELSDQAATEPSPWEVISASMQQPVFGNETRESIRQHGYDVHEEPVLFVVEDNHGGHYMIPQRHITFVSQNQQQ